MVHSRADREALKLRWMEGSATFTTVLSSITMASAKHMANSVHQRRLSSVSRSRSVTSGDPFDDGEECGVEAVPLVRRELVPERLERLEACADHPVDDGAADVGERDEPRAPVRGGLAARDVAPLDEPVDRPGGGWERQAEAGGDVLDGVLAAVIEQEQHLHLGER